MTLRASDIIPISEARARLTELAEDVVGSGAEKVLTKTAPVTSLWWMPKSSITTTRWSWNMLA